VQNLVKTYKLLAELRMKRAHRTVARSPRTPKWRHQRKDCKL